MTPCVTSSLGVPCSHIRSKITLDPCPNVEEETNNASTHWSGDLEPDQPIVVAGMKMLPLLGAITILARRWA